MPTEKFLNIYRKYYDTFKSLSLENKFKNIKIYLTGKTLYLGFISFFTIKISSNWRETDKKYQLFKKVLESKLDNTKIYSIQHIIAYKEYLWLKENKEEIVNSILYIIKEFEKKDLFFDKITIEEAEKDLYFTDGFPINFYVSIYLGVTEGLIENRIKNKNLIINSKKKILEKINNIKTERKIESYRRRANLLAKEGNWIDVLKIFFES